MIDNRYTNRHSARFITADLGFLRVIDPDLEFDTRNEVSIRQQDGMETRFVVKLFREDFDAGLEVFVIDQSSLQSKEGRIECNGFTSKQQRRDYTTYRPVEELFELFSTLAITTIDGRVSLTGPGNSSTLIMRRSDGDTEGGVPVLRMVGIAIGVLTKNDGTTMTIANYNLWDVLQTVGEDDDICSDLGQAQRRSAGCMADVDFVNISEQQLQLNNNRKP